MGLSKIGSNITSKIQKRNQRVLQYQRKVAAVAERKNFTGANKSDIAQLKNQQNWINSFGMSEDAILKSSKIIPYIKKSQKGKINNKKTSNKGIGQALTENEMYNRSYTSNSFLDLGY